MKMLKRIKLIVLGVAVLCLMGGCKQTETKEEAVSTPAPTYDMAEIDRKLNEAEEEYVNYIDIQKITDSIQINNKKVTFPMSLTDFGKNAEFGSLQAVEDSSGKRYRTAISDGQINKAMVSFYSETGTDNAQIYSFEVPASSNLNLQVAGITFGASFEDVVAAVGEPLYQNGSLDDVYRIYYENSVNEYLAFVIENKKVSTIIFCNLPKELK